MRLRSGLLVALVGWLAVGCRTDVSLRPDAGGQASRPVARLEQRIARLAGDLERLGAEVSRNDAATVAAAAVGAASQLAQDYGAIRPAWLNNTLVNFGCKRRGLCYHWAEDLYERLAPLPVVSLRVTRAVAWEGTWREHSAVLVHAAARPPESGLVLDAWRHSGRLYWAPYGQDKFPWRPAQ